MRSVVFATALTCLSLSASAATEPQPPEGAAGGKIIFRKICASCHGNDALGAGPVAQSLKSPPADLTRIAARRNGTFSQDEVAAFIDGRKSIGAHGPRDMPVWGEGLAYAVGDAEVREARITRAIQQLVQYLETIQK